MHSWDRDLNPFLVFPALTLYFVILIAQEKRDFHYKKVIKFVTLPIFRGVKQMPVFHTLLFCLPCQIVLFRHYFQLNSETMSNPLELRPPNFSWNVY